MSLFNRFVPDDLYLLDEAIGLGEYSLSELISHLTGVIRLIGGCDRLVGSRDSQDDGTEHLFQGLALRLFECLGLSAVSIVINDGRKSGCFDPDPLLGYVSIEDVVRALRSGRLFGAAALESSALCSW